MPRSDHEEALRAAHGKAANGERASWLVEHGPLCWREHPACALAAAAAGERELAEHHAGRARWMQEAAARLRTRGLDDVARRRLTGEAVAEARRVLEQRFARFAARKAGHVGRVVAAAARKASGQ